MEPMIGELSVHEIKQVAIEENLPLTSKTKNSRSRASGLDEDPGVEVLQFANLKAFGT